METFTGCLEDNRIDSEKAKDWYKDIASNVVLDWREKEFGSFKTFPVRNQDGSSSCVAQTLALMLGIENYLEEGKFIEFSAKDIYTRRSNPTGGMIGVEALDIVRKYGVTLEILQPSQNINETEINKIVRSISDLQIAEIFKIKDYYQLPFSVDAIATIMEGGRKNGVAKPVMVWFGFPRAEWDSKPDLTNYTGEMVRHSVTAVEYGMMNGKKGIFIQDSWGLHSSTANGLRFITEDYINSRMVFCAYVNDQANDYEEDTVAIPTSILKYGSKGKDVKLLQTLLSITSDGYFGRVTERKVKEFQIKNGLVPDGVVGKNTWALLIKQIS